MMNKKSIVCIILSVTMIIVALSMGGCQLAKEEDAHAGSQDTFVGVFITYCDEQQYSSGGHTLYEGKTYAELVEVETDGVKSCRYVFKNCEGIPNFSAKVYKGACGAEADYTIAMCNDYVFGANYKYEHKYEGTDAGVLYRTIEGSLYFDKEVVVFINPVYQEADGDIYFKPAEMGEAITSLGECISTLEETVNGGGTIVKTTIALRNAVSEVDIIYMDHENNIVDSHTYFVDDIPENLEIASNIEYVMVKKHFGNNETPRIELYSSEKNYVDIAVQGNGGALKCKSFRLAWK